MDPCQDLPFLVPDLYQEFLESPPALPCLQPGSSSSEKLGMDEGLGRAGFHVDLGCNRFFFFYVQSMARSQTHSEEL